MRHPRTDTVDSYTPGCFTSLAQTRSLSSIFEPKGQADGDVRSIASSPTSSQSVPKLIGVPATPLGTEHCIVGMVQRCLWISDRVFTTYGNCWRSE